MKKLFLKVLTTATLVFLICLAHQLTYEDEIAESKYHAEMVEAELHSDDNISFDFNSFKEGK